MLRSSASFPSTVLALSLAALAGCSSSASDERAPSSSQALVDSADAAAGPVLRFLADGTEPQSGPLAQGDAVRVEYAPSRLPTCRARYTGIAAWSTGFHSRYDGGPNRYVPLGADGRGDGAEQFLDGSGTLDLPS